MVAQWGVRLVKPSGFNELYFQPQISASFRPLAGIEMKGSLARRVQNFNQFDFETRFAQNLKYFYISQKIFALTAKYFLYAGRSLDPGRLSV